jgi:arabinosaccharide transport system substrate-binding protein
MRPVMTDDDGDGEPDRYPLAFWPTDIDKVELLLLQGGGRLFDDEGAPDLASETNARLLARMVSWCVGPDRIAAEVPDFSGRATRSRNRATRSATSSPTGCATSGTRSSRRSRARCA